MKKIRIGFLAMMAATISLAVFAQDIPLKNWPVPPYPSSSAGSGKTLAPDTHLNGRPFVPITPCRLYDSRNTSILAANTTRTIPVDNGPCGGIPAGSDAYSLQITVTGSAPGTSFQVLIAWDSGASRPTAATVNFQAGTQVNNAAIVPAGAANYDIDIYSTITTHVIIDINGYFTDTMFPTNQLVVTGNFNGGAAILGNNINAGTGSHGVGGFASGNGRVYGVQGQISALADPNSGGVHGITTGLALSNTNWTRAGVRGEGNDGNGVVGVTSCTGCVAVIGEKTDSGTGATQTTGYLGFSATSGVHSAGNITATGTKSFVEPDPRDASQVIRYVALEGPEAGTYFRGRGRTIGGRAVISVPDNFRLVTDEAGLSVQITPIGALAPMAVGYVGLDRVEVISEADIEFFYQVNGVRRGYERFRPIEANQYFVPLSPEDRMPESLSEHAKRSLITNGTYNEDGTVNMNTARRLGWVEKWQEAGVR